MRTITRSVEVLASAAALAALAAGHLTAQEQETFLFAARFSDADTLTVKSSGRISIAMADEKNQGWTVVFTRSVEIVSRIIDAENGKPVKAEIEVRSSTQTRECETLGPASTRKSFEHGRTFQATAADGKTSIEFTPPGAAEPQQAPQAAASRIRSAFLHEARAFLPSSAVPKGHEWAAEGTAVASLAAASGLDGATGGAAKFRFDGIAPGAGRLARIEIISFAAEAGLEESGALIRLEGAGDARRDLRIAGLQFDDDIGGEGVTTAVGGVEVARIGSAEGAHQGIDLVAVDGHAAILQRLALHLLQKVQRLAHGRGHSGLA